MLAHRVIPVILCRGRQLIKGKRFDGWRSVGHVQQAARVYAARGVDELMILDIAATPEGRGPDLDLISELAEQNFCPLTVGGGVRTVEDARALLRAGADGVVVGSAGLKAVKAIAEVAGSQAVTAAVDYRRENHHNVVYTHCGKRSLTPMDPVWWARDMVLAGAGQILFTCIDREGTMEGYDLEAMRQLKERGLRVPIVINGGCAGPADMVEAINAGANAVAAGALFQFENVTPRQCAQFLKANGLEARVA